jgi:2-oxoisovalerate dehydrogenase E1 component
MNFDRKDCSNEELIRLYKGMLLPRMIEEKMLLLLRQGRVSKWFSGIGQEAIAVGATLGLDADEWILPLHRNLGVFTSREMPFNGRAVRTDIVTAGKGAFISAAGSMPFAG